MRTVLIFLTLTLSLSCKKQENSGPPPPDPEAEEEFLITSYPLTQLPYHSGYKNDTSKGGPLQSPLLKEASGLAVSRTHEGVLWSHNDQGHSNRLYAIGAKGENYGYFVLNGAGSRDYEDICIGPGPADHVNYLYIGDIGNNDASHKYLVIYRQPEPALSQLQHNGIYQVAAGQIDRIECDYADEPVDCETLMIDPLTKDLYIVSKRGFRSIVYQLPYPPSTTQRNKLKKLVQLPFNTAVSGDISDDGSCIVIKDYQKIYFWKREGKESILSALSRPPLLLPYIPEPQGEAFAWTRNASGYYTLSEQSGTSPAILYFYNRH